MAKRHWGDREGNRERGDPHHQRSEGFHPRKRQKEDERPQPHRKQSGSYPGSLLHTVYGGPSTPAHDGPLKGDGVRTASLLLQLSSSLERDSEAKKSFEKIVGADGLAAYEQLAKQLEAREQTIRDGLHSLPKLPESAMPEPHVPSSLAQALDSDASAHWSTVPPLPEVRDERLARIAFVHRSMHHNDHKKAVTESYERLELLGDAYLEIIATRILCARYPDLASGRLSTLREKLVCNETLAAFSMAYDFHLRARVPDTYLEQGTSRARIWTKLLGDVFEAYVAAVVQSDPAGGFEVAEAWLRRLWSPRLPEPAAESLALPDKNAKQELQRRVGGVGVRLAYDLDRPPAELRGARHWEVAVYLDGWGWARERLGAGQGSSKQLAEAAAAEVAMRNPLTAQVQAIKQAYDDKVRKERAAAAATATATAVDDDDNDAAADTKVDPKVQPQAESEDGPPLKPIEESTLGDAESGR